MALFSECMPKCTQNVLDTADIVRDGRFIVNSARVLLLRVRLQSESVYSIRNEPLDEVKHQKKKEHVSGKSEMNLEVPNHYPVNRNIAVIDDNVPALEPGEEHKTQKAEDGYGVLPQVPDRPTALPISLLYLGHL